MSDAVKFNLVRMMFCIIIGFVLIIIQNRFGGLKADLRTLCITAFAGVTNSFFVVSWLIAIKYGMYMTVDVSITLGTAVPILLSCLTFKESVTVKQLIGLLILSAAVYIMCSYNSQQKGKQGIKTYLILLLCEISSGLTDFSQKLYVGGKTSPNIGMYNFYIYIFSAVTLGIFCFVFRHGEKRTDFKNTWFYIVVMAVCLFGYSYFKTKAAMFLSSVQLYPISQSLALILSTVMASLFFNEKITVKCICGIALSFIAMLFINM